MENKLVFYNQGTIEKNINTLFYLIKSSNIKEYDKKVKNGVKGYLLKINENVLIEVMFRNIELNNKVVFRSSSVEDLFNFYQEYIFTFRNIEEKIAI